MSNIAQMIKAIAGNSGEIEARVCVVTAIDADARTIDCEPLDESAPILGVNLQANQGLSTGIVAFPKKRSHVIVAMMNGGMGGCVIATEEIDRAEVLIEDTSVVLTKDGVVFNGGSFGGLIKVADLTSKINELIDAFNNHTHTLPSGAVSVTGSPSAQSNPAPITVPAITSKHTKVRRDDYENEKVKQ